MTRKEILTNYIAFVKEARKNGFHVLTMACEFKNQRQKVIAKCPKGHTFSMQALHMVGANPRNCSKCSGRGLSLNHYYMIAREIGWSLGENVFSNTMAKYNFICPRGLHVRKVRIDHLKKQPVCMECLKDISFKDLVSLASSKGGEVIDPPKDSYNRKTKITFQCKKGHTFQVGFKDASVNWCPECSNSF
ncbi:MAG: hypothetical protein GY909_15790 [Oligoflexia bacterium]|nr:hypothetical protein [Oligoflexia bacterium]